LLASKRQSREADPAFQKAKRDALLAADPPFAFRREKAEGRRKKAEVIGLLLD
jgi:hypothetical protein